MSKTVYENEDILTVKADQSGIPDYALSFAEQSLYVAAMVEENYNAVMEQIGIEELSIYEATGNEVVYEGASFKAVKDRIIKFFQFLWSKIKGAYEKVLKMYDDRKQKVIDAYANIKESDLDKLPEKFKPIESHDFLGLTETRIKNLADNTATLAAKYFEYQYVESGSISFEDWKAKIDDIDVYVELGKKDVIEGTAESYEALRADFKKTLEGNVVVFGPKEIKYNWKKIVDAAKTKGEFKKIIKQAYKEEKKNIDYVISKFKKTTEAEAKTLQILSNNLKDVLNASHTLLFTVIDVCKRRDSEYMRIFLSVGRALKVSTKGEEGAKNEAADPMIKLGTTQKDLIEASFDW